MAFVIHAYTLDYRKAALTLHSLLTTQSARLRRDWIRTHSVSMQGSPAWTSSVPLNDVIAQTAAADTPLAARFTPAQPRHTRLQTDQRRQGMSSGDPAARASAFCLLAACLSKKSYYKLAHFGRDNSAARHLVCAHRTRRRDKAGGDIHGWSDRLVSDNARWLWCNL